MTEQFKFWDFGSKELNSAAYYDNEYLLSESEEVYAYIRTILPNFGDTGIDALMRVRLICDAHQALKKRELFEENKSWFEDFIRIVFGFDPVDATNLDVIPDLLKDYLAEKIIRQSWHLRTLREEREKERIATEAVISFSELVEEPTISFDDLVRKSN